MRRFLFSILLLPILLGQARAATYYIDLNDYTPAGELAGPCYCGSGPYWTFSGFQNGDIVNFGSVKISAVFDAHSYGRIDPAPVGDYAVIAMKLDTYLGGASLWEPNTYPGPLGSTFHDLTDTATFNLLFSVPETFSIGWDGPGQYTPAIAPAVPEPFTWALLLVGFAGLGLFKLRQQRRTA